MLFDSTMARRRITGKRTDPAAVTEPSSLEEQGSTMQEPPADAGDLTPGQIQGAIRELLNGADVAHLSLGKFRKQVARHLGLGKKGLDGKAVEFASWTKALVEERERPTPAAHIAEVVESMGEEVAGFQCIVYLATVSRLLHYTAIRHC